MQHVTETRGTLQHILRLVCLYAHIIVKVSWKNMHRNAMLYVTEYDLFEALNSDFEPFTFIWNDHIWITG